MLGQIKAAIGRSWYNNGRFQENSILNMQKVILIGGGGHCKSVIDVIEQEGKFQIAGIIDVPEKAGDSVLGYKIIGNDHQIPEFVGKFKNVIITLGQIGSPELRTKLFFLAKECNAVFPVIISPYAYVSTHAILDEGTVVMHGAIVNAGARIGKNCIVNTKSLIEHDAIIGNFCHIATGAIINGGVNLGNNCFIGSNAVIKQYLEVPDNSFLKANSLNK